MCVCVCICVCVGLFCYCWGVFFFAVTLVFPVLPYKTEAETKALLS